MSSSCQEEVDPALHPALRSLAAEQAAHVLKEALSRSMLGSLKGSAAPLKRFGVDIRQVQSWSLCSKNAVSILSGGSFLWASLEQEACHLESILGP